MNKMYELLSKSNNPDRSAFIWNTIASTLNSVQSVFLLIIIAHSEDGIFYSSIFVIAYAIANLMMMIGKYGMRNFQVADVNHQFSFSEYLTSRKITVFLMLLGCAAYILQGILFHDYSFEKIVVIAFICLMRAFDSYEDVYHGKLQNDGQLFIAARIVAVRIILYYILFLAFFLMTGNLALTVVIAVTISCAIGTLMNKVIFSGEASGSHAKSKGEGVALIKTCFPFFICSFLLMYFSNAPKYAADLYLTELEQANFNYIFMPVFVVCLLGNFIFQPLLNKTALLWESNNYKSYRQTVYKQLLFLIGITIFTAVVGWAIGIPVLNLLYDTDLNAYKFDFILLLFSGGLLAAIYLFNMLLTIMKKQKLMLLLFTLASVAIKLGGDWFIRLYSIRGINLVYFAILAALVLSLLAVLEKAIYKQKHHIHTEGDRL